MWNTRTPCQSASSPNNGPERSRNLLASLQSRGWGRRGPDDSIASILPTSIFGAQFNLLTTSTTSAPTDLQQTNVDVQQPFEVSNDLTIQRLESNGSLTSNLSVPSLEIDGLMPPSAFLTSSNSSTMASAPNISNDISSASNEGNGHQRNSVPSASHHSQHHRQERSIGENENENQQASFVSHSRVTKKAHKTSRSSRKNQRYKAIPRDEPDSHGQTGARIQQEPLTLEVTDEFRVLWA